MSANSEEKQFFLPGSYTTVYQSNRLTTGTFEGFGLLHTKIFLAIVKSLQAAIKAELNGHDWQQMNFFEEVSKDSIQVNLILKDVTSPNHYPDAVKAAKELMGLIVKLKKNNTPKGYICFRTLLIGVDEPIKFNGKTILTIYVLKVVAKEIILLDRNKDGTAINFTKYLFETAMSFKSKYTVRLYILISSWKNKGGFYISLDELRKILDLKDQEYKNFAKFKARVLMPAQREMEKNGDCWFNASFEGFENRASKKVIGLNFKVISKMSEEKLKQKIDHLQQILIMHGGFNNKDIQSIKPILNMTMKIDDILVKSIYLIGKKEDGNGKLITDKVAFISKSLLAEFL